MRARLITFATAEFEASARRLARSAARFGLPATIYTPASPLLAEMHRQHPTIARLRRGAGYWLWKPWLITHALAEAVDGDVVVYSDAGAALIADPAPLLGLTREHPVVVFRHAGSPARVWTKRDCFVLMDADTETQWNASTCTASFQFYRAGPEARAFAAQLLAACSDIRILTDLPNTAGHDNLPEFREHRHDQAVLGILAEKHRLRFFPDPSQYGLPHVGAPYEQIFDHHRGQPTRRHWLDRATLPVRQSLQATSRRLLAQLQSRQ